MATPGEALTAPARPVDDRAAFEQAVMPEAKRLFALAMTILGDPGEAEDAVQETVFAAWRHWTALRDTSKPSPWLTRICINQCIHRRRRLLRRVLWSADEWTRSPGVPLDVDDRLLGFDGAFRSLSARQRAVFALHVHHGYTVAECAALVGCRPGTARSHLGRAVATLRKELSDA